MAGIHLLVNTPEATQVDTEVSLVELPGVVGRFEVLAGHAPLITALAQGRIRYVSAEGNQSFIEVKSGFVEIVDNRVTVCAEI